jgi:1-deoxy-D-xylulose-5-phosphate synthase
MSVFGAVPGLRIAAPRDAATLREELREAVAVTDGPTVVRFPRGAVGDDLPALTRLGPVDVLRDGTDVLVVAVGAMARLALEVAERVEAQGISATIVDPRWITPVPQELVDLARSHHLVFTVEDNSRTGGVGARISQALRDADVDVPARDLGIAPRFLDHGSRAEVLAEVGLTAQEVARRIVESVSRLEPQPDTTARTTKDA